VKLAFFVHSVVSDWNHGNAHFLRGVLRELRTRGHEVRVFEPADGWSRTNLVSVHGEEPIREFERRFPGLRSETYDRSIDLRTVLHDVDAAVVHEWNEPWLVAAVGRAAPLALFHDTHHRAVTAPDAMRRYDLSRYAGVLAFGAAVAAVYRERAWHDRVWVWHEAADDCVFRPLGRPREGDLAWVGNWGDGERTRELHEYLLEPAARLGLTGSVFGVRYPQEAVTAVQAAGLRYRGWLSNLQAAEQFARHRVTVHVPRRPYVEALPGVPTIRVFEALASGIPLVSAPWEDAEHLFRDGDFLRARDGAEMEERLRAVLEDHALAGRLAERGRETILARHTCGHRADELVAVLAQLGVGTRPAVAA
jgi:spore maturation protein CgeB